MERAFGHDFGHVRIHTDGNAQQAAELLHAHAFAIGADVFFNEGEYRPGTDRGDRLLLHELTHVVQHDEHRLPAGSGVSSPTDVTETEAYANETQLYPLLNSTSVDAGVSESVEGSATSEGSGAAESEHASTATGQDTPVAASAPILRDDDGQCEEVQTNPDLNIDQIVANAIGPLDQNEEVVDAILAENEERQAQGEEPLTEEVPEELVTSSEEDGAQGEEIGVELQSPGELESMAMETVGVCDGDVSSSVAIEVPEVQAAFSSYSETAQSMVTALSSAGTSTNEAISMAIAEASSLFSARAGRLQTDLVARVRTASQAIDGYVVEANAALDGKLETRKQALATQKQEVVTELNSNAAGFGESITEKTSTLSQQLISLGRTNREAVIAEANRLAGEATELGEGQRSHWANAGNWASIDNDYDAKLAADVGLYAVNTARGVANEIRSSATDVADELQEDGDELGEDLRENGVDLREGYDEKLEGLREWYDEDLTEAEARLERECDGARTQIDEGANSLRGDLSDMSTELGTQLTEGATTINEQLELAGFMAQEAVKGSIEDAIAAIEEQVLEVQAWLDTADPSHWPTLVEVLETLTQELEAEIPTVQGQIEAIAADLVTQIGRGGSEAVTALDTLWGQVDSQIAAFESNAQTMLVTTIVDKIDQDVLAAKVQNEREGWDEQRGRHETELENAATTANEELQKEHDEGTENLNEKKNDALRDMSEPLDALREDLASDCRFMAESPWRARFTQFLGGIGRALWSFLKVLGVIVLVVIVIAALIALCFGFAKVLAIAGVIAGFVAAYSGIITTIAGILTAISIVLAAIPLAMAFIGRANGTVSSFELWSSGGEFVGTVLTEFIDKGVGPLLKGLSAVDAPSDVARSVQALDSVEDSVTGVANLGDNVADVGRGAGAVDEFAEVVPASENVANSLDEVEDIVNASDEVTDVVNASDEVTDVVNASDEVTDVVNASDEVTDVANASDEVTDVVNASDEVADTANASDNAFDGNLRTDSTRYADGWRFDPVNSRWVKPDDLPQWDAYIRAKNAGFEGRFVEFRTSAQGGNVFDPSTGQMVDPSTLSSPSAVDEVADVVNASDEVTDVVNASDEVTDVVNASDEVTDVVNASDEVTDVVNASDEVTDVVNASDEAADVANAGDGVTDPFAGLEHKDLEGPWAATQAGYEVLKGVLASLWLNLNGGAPVNDVGGLQGLMQSDEAAESAE
jgi:cell fate (sporulation/competence/biofilm development) regulator YlbF (YheA/YmcA/DUF963 family)